MPPKQKWLRQEPPGVLKVVPEAALIDEELAALELILVAAVARVIRRVGEGLAVGLLVVAPEDGAVLLIGREVPERGWIEVGGHVVRVQEQRLGESRVEGDCGLELEVDARDVVVLRLAEGEIMGYRQVIDGEAGAELIVQAQLGCRMQLPDPRASENPDTIQDLCMAHDDHNITSYEGSMVGDTVRLKAFLRERQPFRAHQLHLVARWRIYHVILETAVRISKPLFVRPVAGFCG
ncbi:hypothetical protein PG993_000724 [Apiospora rasikravindrae]|uniref:Uncharacterized protein n=1 Tax=Apiospora rasikravindrae TaxID=990691 RepID=A0ABR1U9D8_9PEZI